MSLFDAYPYLALSLAMQAPLAAGLLWCRGQRRLLLLSAALAAPFAFTSYFYVPDYWRPIRVANFLRTGPEDLLVSGAMGACIWVVALWPFRRRVRYHVTAARCVGRYAWVAALGVALAFTTKVLGWRAAPGSLITIGAMALLLAVLRGELWRCALAGAIGFPLCCVPLLSASYRLWPHFAEQWNHANLLGVSMFGVPVEEVAWALVTGATWPLFIGYVFDARWTRPGAEDLPPSLA